MIEKTVQVGLQEGMEAAAQLVQIACQYKSEIRVSLDEKQVNAKSIMGVMMLGIATGESIVIQAQGEDEAEAVADIEKVIRSGVRQ